jgi:hypothetical protein
MALLCAAARNIDPFLRPTLTPVKDRIVKCIAALTVRVVGSTLGAD